MYSASTRSVSKTLRYNTHFQGITQFYLHSLPFIRNRNELYLPLPSEPHLELIYRPRRDGRLSRPWCEVAQAKIQTCKFPIASPALYHTATSAHAYCPPCYNNSIQAFTHIYEQPSRVQPTEKFTNRVTAVNI